ncbi:MAG TPA: hypothetical protein PKD83_12080, partial [Ignavibacteria bacterium]|nr:hypothetical protein [Ignavibacteria bacterium]
MEEAETLKNTSLLPENENGLSKLQIESKKEVDSSYWSFVKYQFKKNKLAMISMYIVMFLVFLALSADFLANSKPLYAVYKGETYFPVLKDYLNTLGISKWNPDMINVNWKTLDNQNKLESVIWTPVPYSSTEIDLANSLSPPKGDHYLGTDGIGRDLLAGIIHGSRV